MGAGAAQREHLLQGGRRLPRRGARRYFRRVAGNLGSPRRSTASGKSVGPTPGCGVAPQAGDSGRTMTAHRVPSGETAHGTRWCYCNSSLSALTGYALTTFLAGLSLVVIISPGL